MLNLLSSSVAPSLLASLPTRPPTPPRDPPTENDDLSAALRFLEDGHDDPKMPITGEQDAKCAGATVPAVTNVTTVTNSTSDTTPAKTAPAGATISPQPRGSAKKVGFSPYPTYHKIPALGQHSSPAPALRQSPLANSSPTAPASGSRPLKSILKASAVAGPHANEAKDGDFASGNPTARNPKDFRQMLHSTLLQLEGPTRDGRRDAYMALNGCIKAYMRVPDPQSLAEKMARLTQCLSRDLAWKDATGRLDAQIVQLALSLTCAILFDPETQGLLDSDFQAFVLDRSIFVLEQSDMAKAVVKGHLHLLCVQRFPRSVFAGGRAERLVTVMQNMEARNSMIAARLVIYQRLIERAPTAMLTKVKDWIEHVFHALLSNVNDVQRRAIDVCMQMGMLLGQHPQTAKAISELCEKEIEEGQTYGDYLNMQLIQMTSDAAKAPIVPEIWVAVVLCFRNKRYPIGKWPKFRNWLLTIQKCLNSSDMAVKRPANIAWNRLVFTIMPDSSTSELLRSMLKVPIVAGLERRGNSELSQQLRQLALGSYCNLLHYAMRPELGHEELDLAWDMYVGPILMKISKAGSKGRNIAFRILHGFLKKTGGTWNANAANELMPIQPQDLPRLDVRWVRSRIARFTTVMEPIMIATMSASVDAPSAIDECWRTLMAAIAEAGSQEVKASNELKGVIAQMINLFRRLWSSGSQVSAGQDPAAWLSRYKSLLQLTVDGLGPGHFVEDVLTRTGEDEIEAVPTPTHRSSKSHSKACSPFVLLFVLYLEPPAPLRSPALVRDCAVWFLGLVSGAKLSTSSLLGLLQKYLHASAEISSTYQWIPGQLWNAVADTATQALTRQASLSPQKDTIVMGIALKHTVSIILEGLHHTDVNCHSTMFRLYNAACHSARHVAGNGGIVLAVMEPLARLVHEQLANLSLTAVLQLTNAMAESGVWPSTRSELDQSRKALWTVSLEPYKMQVFDPFDHAYRLFDSVLDVAYGRCQTMAVEDQQMASTAMSAIMGFLQRCPSTLFQTAFLKLQQGYATWAEDRGGVIFSHADNVPTSSLEKERDVGVTLPMAIEQVWSQLLSLLVEKLPQRNSEILELIEPCLLAGLSSSSKSIVNNTIDFWNSTFALQPKLEYPVKLFPVLRERQAQTDLILPGFPQPRERELSSELTDFASSQQSSLVDRRSAVSAIRSLPRRIDASENIYIKQLLEAEREPSNAEADGSSIVAPSKVRPRINDSQVHFAPIEPNKQLASVDSQSLTEHQREVRDRQQAQVHAYPGMSSSPLTSATRNYQHGDKNVKFISDLHRTVDGDIVVTPTATRDDVLVSDDLPSSPTPRSKVEAGSPGHPHTLEEETDHEDAEVDPPSSPPRAMENDNDAAEHLPEHTAADLDTAASILAEATPTAHTKGSTDEQATCADSDLPSDTPLPNAQLQLEEAMATIQSTAPFTSASTHSDQSEPQTPSKSQDVAQENYNLSQDGNVATQTPQSLKKRKRMVDTDHSARKRKNVSPMNKLLSAFQGPTDDDIGEEIVIAAREPASPGAAAEASIEAENTTETPTLSLGAVSTVERAEATVEPAKRRRGRPRRKQPQGSATSTPEPVLGIKRPASELGVQSSKSPRLAKAVVRQTRLSKSIMLQSQEATDSSQLAETDERVPESQTNSQVPDVESQESPMSVAAYDVAKRKIAQPQSILSRLRGILADCKNMILGSQEEEREFDDVLFEIRREVHDAGCRRRAG